MTKYCADKVERKSVGRIIQSLEGEKWIEYGDNGVVVAERGWDELGGTPGQDYTPPITTQIQEPQPVDLVEPPKQEFQHKMSRLSQVREEIKRLKTQVRPTSWRHHDRNV